MWCYQKPGFESLLLAELQRQQQCSQFCDTLLQAEGVSVPAHSCILSAISPHFSSALSSSPATPPGQSRLLEFQALGACTLLHLIRLLYSGEMAGEGETEKQQAIRAAAKLGISGLVEVKKSQTEEGRVTGGQYAEVGVQTEESEGGIGKWRREVRDGCTYLWKETLSDGGKDIWTQTEERQVNLLPPAHPAASFETIDMDAFQSLGQTDAHQFIPITIVYPPDENQTVLVPSDAPACVEETAALPYPSVPPSFPYCSRQTVPQSSCTDPQGAGGDEEWEDERIEQFDGNIAGFINYFMNTTRAEGPRGRRRAGRRRAGRRPRGARGPGTGQQRAGRPRGRPTGRGRKGFTQRVDVQEAGAGKLQMQFLHRWGKRTPRTGQGGGAVGRKLFLKEREVPPAARRAPSRTGRGNVKEVSQSWDPVLCSEGGGRNTQQGGENTLTQFHQGSLAVGRDRRSTPKSTPVPFPAPSKEIHSRPPLSASSLSLSDTLRSPAASCVSTALPVLRSTRLQPLAPPTHENQPEHIDRLLEEVMMGLDILPTNHSVRAPHSERELPGSSSCGGVGPSGNTQNRQQGPVTAVPVLQQQCEGELSDMLETFLQSFEQHAESCNKTGDGSSSEAGQLYTILSKSKRSETQTETPHSLRLRSKKAVRATNRPETPELQNEGSELMDCAASSEHAERNTGAKRSKRKKRNYLFSLEKKMNKSVSSEAQKVKDQQIPVAESETNGLLLGQSHLQVKKTKTRASTVKSSQNSISGNFCQENWIRKSYPIRSRFKAAQITDITAFLEVPLPAKRSKGLGRGRGGRSRTNRQFLSSSNGESTAAPVHPQPPDSCCTDDPPETNQDRSKDLMAQPQEESGRPTGSAQKRANEDMSEEAPPNPNKRICLDQSETLAPSPEPAEFVSSMEQEEVIDVETVSLATGLISCFQGANQEDEQFMEESSTSEEVESSHDEFVDVEGDQEDAETLRRETDHSRLSRLASPSRPAKLTSPEWTENRDEDSDSDIDVIGGSSPAPNPVNISWTESFQDGEEAGEEVDVVGETMDCISSFIHAAAKKRELNYGKHQTEALSH